MSWWDSFTSAVSEAFSGGSSNTSSSSSGGYEEAAYGGSKNDYYESLDSSFDNNNDDDSTTGLPAVSYPTVEEVTKDLLNQYSEEEKKAKYAHDGSGNVILDSKGNPVSTPDTYKNWQEQQEREAEEQRKAAEQARLELERFEQVQERQATFDSEYADILFGEGVNTSFQFNPNVGAPTLDTPELLDYLGTVDDKNVTLQDLEDYTGLLANNDRENIAVFDDTLVAKDNFSVAGAAGKFGERLGNSVLGFFGGLLGGNLTYNITGDPNAALNTALGANQATKFFKALEVDTYVDAKGNQYVKSSLFGKDEFRTMEEVEANHAKAVEEAAKWAENSSSDEIAGSMAAGMAMAGQGSRGSSWEDAYRNATKIDLEDIAKQTLKGTVQASDIKSLEFGTRVALGEDIVATAFDVYGEAVRDILPDGYEKPTEAAVRIGMGENRVAVLGDVYGDDFNLDTPMGKAGLKAATVYDMTGDKDKALRDGVFTFFKEGGAKEWKLGDFKVPDWLPKDLGLDVSNWDFWKTAGFNVKDLLKFTDFDFKSINFGGLKLDEIDGLSLDNLGDFDLELPDLPDMGIDISLETEGLKDLKLDLDFNRALELKGREDSTKGKVLAATEAEEFVPLESEFDLPQTQDLASFLIEGATKQNA